VSPGNENKEIPIKEKVIKPSISIENKNKNKEISNQIYNSSLIKKKIKELNNPKEKNKQSSDLKGNKNKEFNNKNKEFNIKESNNQKEIKVINEKQNVKNKLNAQKEKEQKIITKNNKNILINKQELFSESIQMKQKQKQEVISKNSSNYKSGNYNANSIKYKNDKINIHFNTKIKEDNKGKKTYTENVKSIGNSAKAKSIIQNQRIKKAISLEKIVTKNNNEKTFKPSTNIGIKSNYVNNKSNNPQKYAKPKIIQSKDKKKYSFPSYLNAYNNNIRKNVVSQKKPIDFKNNNNIYL
jgi:hypothetical protein